MPLSQKEAITEAQEAIIRRYGGEIKPVSVQGVPAGQRVIFKRAGKPARCVIKFSSPKSNGRISFAPTEDGGFSGLSDTDFVAVVAPKSPGSAEWLLSFYDQGTLLRAFTANREALRASGSSEGGQSWLAPFHEEGRNFRGEGEHLPSSFRVGPASRVCLRRTPKEALLSSHAGEPNVEPLRRDS